MYTFIYMIAITFNDLKINNLATVTTVILDIFYNYLLSTKNQLVQINWFVLYNFIIKVRASGVDV